MTASTVAPPTAAMTMPRLPVAQAVWKCRPNFEDACAAWIYAGGAHHTGFSQALTSAHLQDFASMLGVEFIRIGAGTDLAALEKARGAAAARRVS